MLSQVAKLVGLCNYKVISSAVKRLYKVLLRSDLGSTHIEHLFSDSGKIL